MANIQKLIQKMLSKPTDMREDEVERILAHYGHKRSKTSGTSHRKYLCHGKPPIIFAVAKGKVKKVYLIEIVKLLGLEER